MRIRCEKLTAAVVLVAAVASALGDGSASRYNLGSSAENSGGVGPRRKLASSMKFMGKKPSAGAKAKQAEARHGPGLEAPLGLVALPLQPPSGQCATASARAHPGAMCSRGQRNAVVRLVHIPKAGGMSLSCTFAPPRHEGLCRERMADRLGVKSMNHSFQGQSHETYFQIKEQRGCRGDVYLKGGANCAPTPDSCEPLVAFLAHPLDRFLSAFFQSYRDDKVEDCNFLRCKPGGLLSKRYSGSRGPTGSGRPHSPVLPEEYALWEPRSDVEKGFNMATWYLGYDGEASSAVLVSVTSGTPAQQHQALLTSDFAVRDDAAGRRMLARAKARLAELDFVGLAGRFEESVELLAWQLGLPLDRFCSCNVNAFKRSATAFTGNARLKPEAHRVKGTTGTGASPPGVVSGDHGGPLSALAVARVLADNALDVELYDFAVGLYEAQLNAYRASFHAPPAQPPRDDGGSSLGGNRGGDNKVVAAKTLVNHMVSRGNGGGFVCDKGRMLCMEKSFLGAGPSNYQIKWYPPEVFQKRNRHYITKGWHSSCSYMCYREACTKANSTAG